MSVSLDEILEIARRNADEAFRDGHRELAKNAMGVWIDTRLQILDLESCFDRADCEMNYFQEEREGEQ